MRTAIAADIPQLVALMQEFYAESSYPLNHRRAVEAFAALLADERLGAVFFIQADEQDVGYLVVTLGFSMEYGGPQAFVDDMFIRPAFRGAGLGTAALAYVREHCLERGVRVMHVEAGRDNAAAQAAYRRAGFVPNDRQLLSLRLANSTHEE